MSIKNAINASSANNRLCFIVAGPHAVAYMGLKASNTSAHQHVTLISHSDWNNKHSDTSQMKGKTLSDIKQKFSTVKTQQIKGQNTLLGNVGGEQAWSFLKTFQSTTNDKYDTLYKRIAMVNEKVPGTDQWIGVHTSGDVSDSGMTYYILTGDQQGNPTKFKNYLQP